MFLIFKFTPKELDTFVKMGWLFYNDRGARALKKLNFYKEIECMLGPDFLSNSSDEIEEHPILHKYSHLLDSTVEPQANPQPDPPITPNTVASTSMDIGEPQANSTRI